MLCNFLKNEIENQFGDICLLEKKKCSEKTRQVKINSRFFCICPGVRAKQAVGNFLSLVTEGHIFS